VKIGVLSIQGDVKEHAAALEKASAVKGIDVAVTLVRRVEHLRDLDRLIIPGGESTTISKFLWSQGLSDAIKKHAKDGMPIFGTCAGSVLLSSNILGKNPPRPLGLMDMTVDRNIYGSQKQSFEAELDLPFSAKPYNAVFIRAPGIVEVNADCNALVDLDGTIVMAKQGALLAVTFHPELTADTRIHEYFLGL